MTLDNNDIIIFIKWLCERWYEWGHRGRPLIVDEYKRFIRGAINLLRRVTEQSFSEVAKAVGQVTGHHANTLDVIFPDRVIETRQILFATLRHSVLTNFPVVDPALAPTPTDAEELLDWLEKKNNFTLHNINRGIIASRFRNTHFDHAALAREVGALALSF